MVDVTIVNNSDQTVSLRLDESNDRDKDMLEHLKTMHRREEFKSLTVKGEAPKRSARGRDES